MGRAFYHYYYCTVAVLTEANIYFHILLHYHMIGRLVLYEKIYICPIDEDKGLFNELTLESVLHIETFLNIKLEIRRMY